jgi:hypothetical protein
VQLESVNQSLARSLSAGAMIQDLHNFAVRTFRAEKEEAVIETGCSFEIPV